MNAFRTGYKTPNGSRSPGIRPAVPKEIHEKRN